MYVQYYYPHTEPWEQNITTLKDFASKWKDMMEETPVHDGSDEAKAAAGNGVGLYEGAGYQSKGVWRPAVDCRMHTNRADCFCPVCQRAISRIIEFYTTARK